MGHKDTQSTRPTSDPTPSAKAGDAPGTPHRDAGKFHVAHAFVHAGKKILLRRANMHYVYFGRSVPRLSVTCHASRGEPEWILDDRDEQHRIADHFPKPLDIEGMLRQLAPIAGMLPDPLPAEQLSVLAEEQDRWVSGQDLFDPSLVKEVESLIDSSHEEVESLIDSSHEEVEDLASAEVFLSAAADTWADCTERLSALSKKLEHLEATFLGAKS